MASAIMKKIALTLQKFTVQQISNCQPFKVWVSASPSVNGNGQLASARKVITCESPHINVISVAMLECWNWT